MTDNVQLSKKVSVTKNTGLASLKAFRNNFDLKNKINSFLSDQSSEVDAGNTGTAITLNLANSDNYSMTATDNFTLTLQNPTEGKVYRLKVIQDATGSRTITLPANNLTAGGAGITLTVAANAVDLLEVYYDGTDYIFTSLLNLS